jgi:hypothetical protein
VACSGVGGDESSSFLKGGEFIEQLRDCRLLNNDTATFN